MICKLIKLGMLSAVGLTVAGGLGTLVVVGVVTKKWPELGAMGEIEKSVNGQRDKPGISAA